MPRKSSLEKARANVVDFFHQQCTRIYSLSELDQILDFYREDWGIAKSVSFPKFLSFIVDELGFQVEDCSFPSRTYTRCTLGQVSLYEVLLSLIPNSYFSHFTALDLHKLTDKTPDQIYLNFPQERKKERDTSLGQSAIDSAFRRPVRISKTSAQFRGNTVLLLNSMGTANLGITELKEKESSFRITDMERTLIDIVVRPVYSGGISNVLAAYRKAVGKVSVSRLVEILQSLDFAYPYHQSIGFCLERSGHKDSEIDLLRKIPMRHDFYLDYQMGETEYSKNWRLHFPKGLDEPI